MLQLVTDFITVTTLLLLQPPYIRGGFVTLFVTLHDIPPNPPLRILNLTKYPSYAYYLIMTTEQSIARPPKIAKDGRIMSSASLANLKPPYKPGTNGHGRVYPLKERLQHALDKPLRAPTDDAPVGDHIVYATLKGAIDLVPVAVRETWDRVEGKVTDPSQLAGNVTINIQVNYPDGYSPQLSRTAEQPIYGEVV